jgi:hypothetical protein
MVEMGGEEAEMVALDQLFGAICGLAIALALWLVWLTMSGVHHDRRRVGLLDAGVGVALALSICSLSVASEPAAGIVVTALVVEGMVVAALALAVWHHDHLDGFRTAPATGSNVRPAAHQPALSDCHRRPRLARRTSRSRPPCARVRSRTRAVQDRPADAVR